MRKILHDGPDQLEILGKDDCILRFRDIPAAMEFLRRFRNDPAQMSILRSLAAGHARDLHRLNAEDTLKRVASLLVSGRIKILGSLPVRGSSAQEALEEEARQGAAAAPPLSAGKTGWIEINLRDMEGQPVPGKKYRIKLPDGSVQEGNLDAFGHAEYYGINSGTCQFSFSELDGEAWERA